MPYPLGHRGLKHVMSRVLDRTIAYFIIGSRKEGYLSRVGKVKPTLLTFPPISLPPSGLRVDPREPSGDRNNDTSG